MKLYGDETWTVYRSHVKKLHAYDETYAVNHEDQMAGQSDYQAVTIKRAADSFLWKTSSSEKISAGQDTF